MTNERRELVVVVWWGGGAEAARACFGAKNAPEHFFIFDSLLRFQPFK